MSDTAAERERLAEQHDAAAAIVHAVAVLNAPLAELPRALRILGNAPEFRPGAPMPFELRRVTDVLARLDIAARQLREAVKDWRKVDRLPAAWSDQVADAELAVADLAAAVVAQFQPAIEFFTASTQREEIAETALHVAWDWEHGRTGWPWADLAAINGRLAAADREASREIRRTTKGVLRVHDLEMDRLRGAGLGRLAARVEFECREVLGRLRGYSARVPVELY